MRTKKSFALICILVMGIVLCPLHVSAQQDDEIQAQKEIVKKRKEMSKLTRKQVADNVWKQAKKQAKVWKKEGWKSSPGLPSLEQQMNDALMCQYELDGNFPRYIVGRSSGTAATYALARKQAIARARADIAGAIQTEVAELMETTDTNKELTTVEAESIGKMLATGQQFVQQTIGRTNVVFEAYREKGGETEVMVSVSYDGRAAKSVILELLAKESDTLREKLEKMLNGK